MYVGTRTGYVYALDQKTGAVLWRFLAAPHQRLIMSYGQAESAWPVFGSVIEHEGLIWATAGRQAELDFGLFWYGFDPQTGAVKRQGRFSQMADFHLYARLACLKNTRNTAPKIVWRLGPIP